MKEHIFYSIRTGKNRNVNGFSIDELKDLFLRIFDQLKADGYFAESFGFSCADAGFIEGKIRDVELETFLKIQKKDIWPIEDHISKYTEDDLFDIIEFLHLHISKPVDGTYHDSNDCGMHWESFHKAEGQSDFREKMNELLDLYKEPFELSENGEILHKARRRIV